MHSTSKGRHWHFGMKAHIGVDSASGIVHSASVSAANEHDSQQLSNLLHSDKTRLYGDSAYANQKEALKAKDFTNKRAYRNKPLTERDKQVNRIKSQPKSGSYPVAGSPSGGLNGSSTGAILSLT
jgi:transposase, IS5 family